MTETNLNILIQFGWVEIQDNEFKFYFLYTYITVISNVIYDWIIFQIEYLI